MCRSCVAGPFERRQTGVTLEVFLLRCCPSRGRKRGEQGGRGVPSVFLSFVGTYSRGKAASLRRRAVRAWVVRTTPGKRQETWRKDLFPRPFAAAADPHTHIQSIQHIYFYTKYGVYIYHRTTYVRYTTITVCGNKNRLPLLLRYPVSSLATQSITRIPPSTAIFTKITRARHVTHMSSVRLDRW